MVISRRGPAALVSIESGPEPRPGLTLKAYVLARNEEVNLAACAKALATVGVPAIVLDSHSTDRTRQIALQYGCAAEYYDYRDHLEALRYICEDRTPRHEFAMVLDADMIVSPELVHEALSLLNERNADVAVAPVRMYWNGRLLPHGSMYPPKAFIFRGGGHYFEARGHGEGLLPGTQTVVTRHELMHNDRKPFQAYLSSQVRYAENLLHRRSSRKLNWRDRLRTTPLMMLLSPAFSYFVRGGIFSGNAGVGYALDRLIAEAVMYRQHVASSHSPGDGHQMNESDQR